MEPGVHILRVDGTIFVMTIHPTYRGVTSGYFVRVGGMMRALLGDRG